ncbi:MAG TPA: hypothetical protein VF599_00125 [Pyrinomonadaceae bacterium]|jgi:hypothetical protein
MKNFISGIFVIVLFAAVLGTGVLFNTKFFGGEKIPASNNGDAAAPPECLKTFDEFFEYVYNGKGKTNIAEDAAAQEKWLSKHLKKIFTENIKVMSKPDNSHDFPSNGTFVGSWEFPASFSVAGSRRYENRSVVDVRYKWGRGQNYEGDERLTSFIFVLEDGKWKLDDIYTFRGEFIGEGSLVQDLKTANKSH